MAIEEIVLGGGCFWCLEAIYQELRGVLSVQSGYCGGARDNPRYEQVCSGESGHAEVVKIRFDVTLISLRDLLEIFFTMHDPTTLNRQGNDVGTQYRSCIFFHSAAQGELARHIKTEMANVWDAEIVTEILPLPKFYPAEEYHQNYFQQHAEKAYCAMVIAPKVSKLRKMFIAKCKA